MLLLVTAISLDSFTVGTTYGLRKMKMPFKSLKIVFICAVLMITSAMYFGQVLTSYIPQEWAGKIGGIILVVIGLWVLYQFFKPSREDNRQNEKMLFKLELESAGLVIQILRKPMKADIDRSGEITGVEAILLGLALSLDAFGVGIGAALIGSSSVLLAVLAAIMSAGFLYLGMKCGRYFSNSQWFQKLSFLPGIILIIIGIFKI